MPTMASPCGAIAPPSSGVVKSRACEGRRMGHQRLRLKPGAYRFGVVGEPLDAIGWSISCAESRES
jgi:hypothetical protein